MRIGRMGLVIALVACVATAPARADGPQKLKTLGTDPSGDGPPSLDVTSLEVGRSGDVLEIRIGIFGMLPGAGGIPALPGIEWTFTVNGRTFIAEAVANPGSPEFYLFEAIGDTYNQLESPEGTYDWQDGYTSMLVPLKTIGAKRGSKIAGVSQADVDSHVHLGPQTHYPDTMTTTKAYVVP